MTDIQQAYNILEEKLLLYDTSGSMTSAIFFLVGRGYEEKEATEIIEKYYTESYNYEKNTINNNGAATLPKRD